ncbi:MAG: ABC transporter ATP-binding protein [Methanomassiliicoccales archaeon]
MEAAIEAVDLHKSYGELKAVNGLSLRIRTGEVFSLLGPNGAGKTTTIEMLEGIRKPDAGTISVLGMDPWKEEKRMHMRVGIIPQGFNFIQRITPREGIRYFCELFGVPDRSEELLDLVDLKRVQDTYYMNLSGGQKQKFGLCLALVHDPEVIFLDEPTTGLDPQARRNMWEVIRRLQTQGKTILLTTHYLEEAQALSDRVGIVKEGRMLAEGTPAEIIAKYGRGKRLIISADTQLASQLREKANGQIEQRDGTLIIQLGDGHGLAEMLRLIGNYNGKLEKIELKEDTLEDVFIEMVGKVND